MSLAAASKHIKVLDAAGLIRREIPVEYDPYLKSLIRYLRDARTKAVEPLFADTVVPSRQT